MWTANGLMSSSIVVNGRTALVSVPVSVHALGVQLPVSATVSARDASATFDGLFENAEQERTEEVPE